LEFILANKSLQNDEKLFRTPFGLFPQRCVQEVPSGSHIEEFEDGSLKVTIPNGDIMHIPKRNCSFHKLVQKRREYDGWLAYTTFHYPNGLDAFLGYFTVPVNPQDDPEVLYLFTGLQNVDWIPIVDPEPAIFDIIQPVLQYPGDISDWGVRSWYVTLDSGVLVSNEIGVTSGDNIFGNMTRISGTNWYIGGTSSQTGETSSLTVSRNRLLTQPWAYNTAEGYGVEDCSNEPTNGCIFTKLELFSKGKQVIPKWVSHKSPSPKCNEKATISSSNKVIITFQY